MARRQSDGLRCIWHWPKIKTLRRNVDQRGAKLQRSLTVRNRVVKLGDHGGLATWQTLEHGDSPQRTIAVEVGHALPAAFVEDIFPGRSFGCSESTHVEAQVEVRVHNQSRIGDCNWAFDDLLAENRHDAARAVVAFNQAIPVGRLFENEQPDHGRAHHGIFRGRTPRGKIPTGKSFDSRHQSLLNVR